ncbi:MAG: hypothetical protein Fur0042_26090 [Cyanophyceae cyanobacterium]
MSQPEWSETSETSETVKGMSRWSQIERDVKVWSQALALRAVPVTATAIAERTHHPLEYVEAVLSQLPTCGLVAG